MYVEMISDLLDLFNKLLNVMTEVGVLESFTFMHSAINLNLQHEQFLRRIQSSIDELKKWLQNVCTEWKAEDLVSLGNVIEPPMTPNNMDLNMNGPDYITPLIKEKIDSVLGFRNPVSPILWSVGLRPIQDSNSKDGFEMDDNQTLPTDFVAPSFEDYGSPSSEPWNVFQECNYDLDQTNMDEKGPQTPNIKMFRKEEPDIILNIGTHSSCFPNEINQDLNVLYCQKCNREFKLFGELEEHLKTHKPKSKSTNLHLICAYCNKTFYKKSNLCLHMLIHENVKPYACSYCDRQFTQKSTRDIHLKKHTGDYMYTCYVCSRQYATKGKLNFHMKTHQEPQYTCIMCNKQFATQQYLNYHMKVHPDRNTFGFNCDICQIAFNKKNTLVAHIKREHPFCTLKCTVIECGKEFSTVQLLNRHIKRMHEKKTNGKDDVICSQCGKLFSFPNYLQKHIARVHGPDRLPRYKCRQCNLRFDDDVMLHVHMQQSHPKDEKKKESKRVSCPRESCNLTFYNRVGLRYHIAEKHDNIYRYECETCQKKFIRKNHFELHKVTHMKPHFTCNMCNKRFRKKNRLAAHWKKTHQQEIFDFDMLFGVDDL